MSKEELTSKEAKAIIKKLLQSRKTNLEESTFQDLFSLAMQPQNRKPLLLSDVHIVLNEYYDYHKGSPNIVVILKLVEFLAESTTLNYPLAVNGNFLMNILKYFDSIIDKEIDDKVYDGLDDKQKNTPSEIEKFYNFDRRYDGAIVTSYSKVFKLLMMNKHTVKWLARNSIEELKSVFIVLMLAAGEGEDDIRDNLLDGLSYLFQEKEVIEAINKSPYVSSWLFSSLIDICSTEYTNMIKYLEWISKMLEIKDFSKKMKMTKNSKNHSNYLTQIITMTMAGFCFKKTMKKTSFFNFQGQLTNTELKKLVSSICYIFSLSIQNDFFKKNIVEFSKKNSMDVFYRFLIELLRYGFELEFCELAISMTELLEGYEYTLPHCYRKLSVFFLEQVYQKNEFFLFVNICKVNRYFFYDALHRKFVTLVTESFLNKKENQFEEEFRERLYEVDIFLLKILKEKELLFETRAARIPRKGRSSSSSSGESQTDRGSRLGNDGPIEVSPGVQGDNQPDKTVPDNKGPLPANNISIDSDSGTGDDSSQDSAPRDVEIVNQPPELDNDAFMPPPTPSGSESRRSGSGSRTNSNSGSGSGTNSKSGSRRDNDGKFSNSGTNSRSSSRQSGSNSKNPNSSSNSQSRSSSQPSFSKSKSKDLNSGNSRSNRLDRFKSSLNRHQIDYSDTDFTRESSNLPFFKKKSKRATIPEKFIFEKIHENPSIAKKYKFYIFQNTSKESDNFKFFKHCQHTCKYCNLFSGFYSLNHQDFKTFCLSKLQTGQIRPHEFTNHKGFTLAQFFFEIFLSQESFEFLEITLNFVCRTLVSKNVDIRVKTAFVLYTQQACSIYPQMVKLLIATNYYLYLSDYMAEYMQNFKLMSFKKVMANKFEGDLEVEVIPERRLQVDPIMAPLKRGQSRTATVINLERHGDGMIESTIINFKKKVIYKDCVWDDMDRKFAYMKVILSPLIWRKIREYQVDYGYDKGIYTYYFWRLHCLLHLLRIFGLIMDHVKGKAKDEMCKLAGSLPLQFIEMSVLFKDYMKFFVPKKPFAIDSECWDKIKGLSSEFNILLKKLMTKSSRLLNSTVSICSSNIKYISGYLDLMETMPTLENTNIFFKNLMLISSKMLEIDPESIDIEPYVVDKFVINLIKKIRSIHQSTQQIFKNNLELKEKNFFNERGLKVTFEFATLSLQIVNLLGIEKLLNWDDKAGIKEMITNLLSFNLSTFNVFRNAQKIYYKYSRRAKYLSDYNKSAKKYYKVLNLFLWWASGVGSEECGLVIGSRLLGVLMQKIENLGFEGKDYFSTYCVIAGGCKWFVGINVIEKKMKNFMKFVNVQISRFHNLKPKIEFIFPLIRSIVLILKKEKHEAVRFVPMKKDLELLLEEISNLLNRKPKEVKSLENFFGDLDDLSIIEEEGDNFLELNRTWLSQGDVSFIKNTTPFVNKSNKAKVSVERIPILSALERGVIYILKLIEKRSKVRNKIKEEFKQFGDNKKGMMSLETMTGLKRREDIRNQVQRSLHTGPKRFHAEPERLHPKTEMVSRQGTLGNLTLFSNQDNTVLQSRVQGKPLEYFKRPIMPGVDLRKDAEYREKRNDTLKNMNYFSFDNSSSLTSNLNFGMTGDPKYGVREKKKDYSQSTKSLRKDYSRKRFTNTARNLLGSGEERRPYGVRGADREGMARKMMQAFRDKEEGRAGKGLIGRVDAVYESLFKKGF